jgi:hypothetical protein
MCETPCHTLKDEGRKAKQVLLGVGTSGKERVNGRDEEG